MKFPIGEDRIPLSWLPATHPARKNHMDLKTAAEIVYGGAMGTIESEALKIRRENRERHLSLVHSQDEAQVMATRLQAEIKLANEQIREHRQTIAALERLKDRKGAQLEALLRSIARGAP